MLDVERMERTIYGEKADCILADRRNDMSEVINNLRYWISEAMTFIPELSRKAEAEITNIINDAWMSENTKREGAVLNDTNYSIYQKLDTILNSEVSCCM